LAFISSQDWLVKRLLRVPWPRLNTIGIAIRKYPSSIRSKPKHREELDKSFGSRRLRVFAKPSDSLLRQRPRFIRSLFDRDELRDELHDVDPAFAAQPCPRKTLKNPEP
jgi:hypothetical protein